MKKSKLSILSVLLVLVALAIAACGTVAPASEQPVMEKETSSEVMVEEKSDDVMMEKDDNSEAMIDGHEGDDDAMMEEKSDDAMMEKDDDDSDAMMDSHDGDSDDAMEKDDDAMMEKDDDSETMMMETPNWFGAELINAHTAETFTVNDFEGKTVLVETMAIWCSNCLRQQKEVKMLNETLGERDDLAILVLDIDTNDNPDTLKSYAEKNGFSWNYAVASADVAREIGQLYGDQFLNPPSTPMFIIDSKGEVHPLDFGHKSAEALETALKPFLTDAM